MYILFSDGNKVITWMWVKKGSMPRLIYAVLRLLGFDGAILFSGASNSPRGTNTGKLEKGVMVVAACMDLI